MRCAGLVVPIRRTVSADRRCDSWMGNTPRRHAGSDWFDTEPVGTGHPHMGGRLAQLRESAVVPQLSLNLTSAVIATASLGLVLGWITEILRAAIVRRLVPERSRL